MASLNCCIRNCFPFRTRFIQNYRNVMRLKQFSRPVSILTCVPDFYDASDKKFIHSSKPLVSVMQIGNVSNMDYFSNRGMSRWTRYTQNNDILLNQTSRKKYRSRSVQFTDKVKAKILIAKRETRRKVAKMHEIKENVLTVPNGLCVLRIVSTPILAYLVLSEFYTASLGLFIFAGFTDLIDGYIARNFANQQTMIGSFLDPAADKLLIATLFITLTANGLIPVPLTSLIIFRDVCLMGAGFYIRFVSLPPPKTLSRYFDMSFVTARLSPTTISKVNTLIQLTLVATSLAAPVFGFVDHIYLQILWYITGTTTALSAGSYLYLNHSTYKLFTAPEEKSNKK